MSREFVFAFVAFQIQVFAFRVRIDGSIQRERMGEKVGSRDAIELCGQADRADLADLDEPCDSNNTDPNDPLRESESLRTIFTSRGQPGGYRLPPYRLYVCHPNAVAKGILFSTHGMTTIITDVDMQETINLLFGDSLWNLKPTFSESVYRKWKQFSGYVKGRVARDSNSIYLWVLDRDGNIIFAPEVQGDLLFKHGDLTPGRAPWERAAEGVSHSKQEVACCCSSASDEASCKYKFIGNGDNKEKLCCKWRVEGCSSLSSFSKKVDSSVCNMPNVFEQYSAGEYRGIARAGGEMRFPNGQPPLIQDKSGYSLARLSLDGSERNDAQISKSLKKAKPAPSLGVCSMKKLKTYWQGLGMPMDTVTFAAATFDEKGNEILVPV